MFSQLKSDFVVGWKNIQREDYVGSSHGYTCEQAAVGTTNGAGPRNTQMFVLSPGGVVLHALPGFWHPEDLAAELQFSKVLHRLWKDKTRSTKQKKRMFSMLQLSEMRRHSPAMVARSTWQGFDAANERQRLTKVDRDTFEKNAQGQTTKKLKTINVLVHERMAERPFVSFRRFDVEEFADYGRAYYDNNARVDGMGVRFGTPGYMESQKRQSERQRKRADAKAKQMEKAKKIEDAKKAKVKKAKKAKPRRRPTSRPSRKRISERP